MQMDMIFGLHAVAALIKNRREDISELLVLDGRHDRRLQQIIQKSRGLSITKKSRKELNEIAGSEQHQGIIAMVNASAKQPEQLIPEARLSDYIDELAQPILILIIDGVTDPHNLGACLRSADAAGVDLVITPKDKSVGLTPVVRKVACGAAEVIPICQVTNLARAMEMIQRKNIWIYGAAGEAEQSIYEQDLAGDCALVVGAEGKGMRRLTKEKCDYLFNIPMAGSVSSLNVSVATGVCLFEVVRQRKINNAG
jgi:23S rRNA (guanosine2251-2'-O)-methyltransferase